MAKNKQRSWLDADLPKSIKEKLYIKGEINMAHLATRDRGKVIKNYPKPFYYNTKIRQLGDTAEIIHYGDRLINQGYERTWTPTRKEKRTMANEKNAKRARKAIYEIVSINTTKYTKMITLTYSDPNYDYDQLSKDFKRFRYNLKNNGIEFPYLYVVEQHNSEKTAKTRKGSLHIHLIAFIDDYIPIKTLEKAWKKGFIKINAQFDKVEHKGAYIAKYVQKETMPPDKKAYRTSRNIKKPLESQLKGSTHSATRHLYSKGYIERDRYDIILSLNNAFVDIDTGEIQQPKKEYRATVIKLSKTKDQKRSFQILSAFAEGERRKKQ